MPGGVYPRTKEHNQNISKALKGKPQNWPHLGMFGKKPWNKGDKKFNCIVCGKIYEVPPCRYLKTKYCSKKCQKIDFKKRYQGENGSNWKGGKRKTVQGYILIYSPNHPFANNDKSVREHRLIMEKYLRRYLKPEEIVHHLNGIKDDNRIENLALCNGFTHHLFIRQLQERIRELEKTI